MIRRRLKAAARRVSLASLAALAACGGVGDAPDPGHVVVDMRDNSFSPTELRVPVGAEVMFVGAGRNPHNAVAADGSWTTETSFGTLQQMNGDRAVVRFDQPGEYSFFCTFHGTADGSGMAGRLVVGDVDASPAAQGAAESIAPSSWSGVTLRVPEAYPTIQAAVDAAGAGDLVLVGEGVYREAVEITTPGVVLRGTDRNNVVIDAEFQHENVVEGYADGVVVENLTVRNGTANGVYWAGIRGYRASYVTAVNNGDYGIYAFDSSDGVFEHSYASGSPDSGFYIGQCNPCEAVIDQVISEWNGLGYSGTNASSDLFIINSVWRYNTAGIIPNTLDSELLPPFHDVVIAGNLVHDNDNRLAPMRDIAWTGHGNGIFLAGGNTSLVIRNRVVNHSVNGIAIISNPDDNFWTSSYNRVEGNVVDGSGRADIALAGPSGQGNCFIDNEMETTLPVGLEVFATCDGLRLPLMYELAGSTEQLGRVMDNGFDLRPENLVGSAPEPDPQPTMPMGSDAPVKPAVDVFANHPVDLDSIEVPELPAGLIVDQSKGVTVFGVLLGSVTSVFFGLYGYLLPFVLFAVWMTVALWDLMRSDRGRGAVIGWTAVILLVPFLGVILYYVFGRPQLAVWQRWTLVAGGLGA
ncbi:MAG: right-handed parallel beta-helix repeat-containing protein [Acidimicrobiia bacterium]